MPQYENVYVSLFTYSRIQISEYKVRIDEPRRTITAYVPSVDSEIFQIQVEINELRDLNGIDGKYADTKFEASSYEVAAFVDGGDEPQVSTVLAYHTARERDELVKVLIGPVMKSSVTGTNFQTRFRFERAAIELPGHVTQDVAALSLEDKHRVKESAIRGVRTEENARVGTIEIKIYRIALVDTEDRPVKTITFRKVTAPTDEVEHTVGYTLAEPEAVPVDLDEEHSFFTYKRLDLDNLPFMTFRFVYRSQSVLERLGVIPGSTPAPKDILHKTKGEGIGKGKAKIGLNKPGVAAYLAKSLAELDAERQQEAAVRAAREEQLARIKAYEERLGITMPFHISADLIEVERYYQNRIAEEELPKLISPIEDLHIEDIYKFLDDEEIEDDDDADEE